MIGTTLHHYRIIGALGRGGMGEVYVAEDTKLNREVALKILPQDMAEDPARRDQSAQKLRNDLEEAQHRAGTGAGLLRVAARTVASVARRKVRWIAGLLLIALIAGGTFLFLRCDWGIFHAVPATVEKVSQLTTLPGV